ncbi:hypothetical protein FEM48_Zijuj01G0052100 [Ziziphus jujuba var. spinosa]|uniref:Uncharacterized protein n=1 Tax=Ziziphus jujuba var. spinosa TaxID=714518 RepID=A0A978VZB5_ZIZJJ|nr:hypothetical protein FEM48_Zijuj01G0052100 [Ziziphus jujuba var. spinosa]
MELVDPKLGNDFNKEEAVRMLEVALLCLSPSPTLRPIMSAVVSMLEGRSYVSELVRDISNGDQQWLTSPRSQFSPNLHNSSTTESQSLISSSASTWIGSSSTSSKDLYPPNSN